MKNNAKRKSGERRFSLFGGKLTLHPLFLLVGAAQCFTGTLLSFLIIVVCALFHELAHAYTSSNLGYRLNRIILMPYGAVLDGELPDLSAMDEIKIALAGPLANLLCAALFLGVWWCFPTAYAYTDTAFFASLSLGLCNLLPAYPLDGGRILRALLYQSFNAALPPAKAKKRANWICKLLSVLVCIALAVVFIFGAFHAVYVWTAIGFCVFLLVGVFDRKEARYQPIDFSLHDAFLRGVPIKHVAAHQQCTVKQALTFLSQGEYLALEVYNDEERYVGTITQNELSAFFLQRGLYAKLLDFFT